MQRQFLLRPDPATNNAFLYCLAVAAARTGVVVLMTVAMSNHHHTVIYDPEGRCLEFIEHFHKLLSRSQNVLRGRRENLWSIAAPSVTVLVDAQAVIERIVYAAANPVTADLVERAHQWPGVNGYSSLLQGRVLRATRPRHFFSDEGPMPDEVTLQLTIPRELGPTDAVLDRVRRGVEAVEAEMAEKRRRTGKRVLGRRGVLDQSWMACPKTVEPRRTLNPRFAARDVAARVAALTRYRAFLTAYRDARRRMLDGLPALFPAGTYWLRRFAGVAVEPLLTHA